MELFGRDNNYMQFSKRDHELTKRYDPNADQPKGLIETMPITRAPRALAKVMVAHECAANHFWTAGEHAVEGMTQAASARLHEMQADINELASLKEQLGELIDPSQIAEDFLLSVTQEATQ